MERQKPKINVQIALIECLISLTAILATSSWSLIWGIVLCQMLSIFLFSKSARIGFYCVFSALVFVGPLLLVHGVINPQFAATTHVFNLLPVRIEGFMHSAILGGRLSLVSNAGIALSQVRILELTQGLLSLRLPAQVILPIMMAVSLVKEFRRKALVIATAQLARGVPVYGKVSERVSSITSLAIPLIISGLVSSQRRADCLKSRGLELILKLGKVPNSNKSPDNHRIKSICLRNVNDILVKQGEIIVWIGDVDSGKSRLARSIALGENTYAPINYYNENGEIADKRLYSRDISWLPTDPRHVLSGLTDTVEEEIELALMAAHHPIPITNLLRTFELETLRYRDPFTLSGGETFRLSLAVILAKDDNFLILDQCFDSVDQENREKSVKDLMGHTKEMQRAVLFFTNRETDLIPDYTRVLKFCHESETVRAQRPILDVSPIKNRTVLEATNLSFVYGSGFRLQHVDLTIRSGEMIKLRGRNGSGKTTLLKCLALLLNFEGSIKAANSRDGILDNVESRRRRHLWCYRVGYVFQNPTDQLFCSTVREEIGLRSRDTQSVDAAIDSLNLGSYINQNPMDLPLPIQRLVTIATVLAKRPPVILLDEPSSFLDERLSGVLMGTLEIYRAAGHAFVIVSHDARLDGLSYNRAIRLDNGILNLG